MYMKRKLVKQGKRALTITIPSSWVKNNDLKPGDEIDIFETQESLTISLENKQSLKEINVDISGLLPRMADRFMARSYQKGYDKITINYDDPNLMLAIKNKIPELMGFEILNIHKGKIEVNVISSQLNLNFDTMLRRAFLILLDMAKTCHDAWKSGDKQALQNIFYQDFDVNRFTYFCLRELNKGQKLSSFGRSILYYLIESLEDLGDELKQLGKTLSNIKPEKDILDLINKMNEMFRISYEFFYAPKKDKAVNAFILNQEISSSLDNLLDKKSKDSIKALISIEFSLRIIYHITTMRLDTLEALSDNKP